MQLRRFTRGSGNSLGLLIASLLIVVDDPMHRCFGRFQISIGRGQSLLILVDHALRLSASIPCTLIILVTGIRAEIGIRTLHTIEFTLA